MPKRAKEKIQGWGERKSNILHKASLPTVTSHIIK